MRTVLFVVALVLSCGANAQVSYMYNYSQVPIAPIVHPYGGYNSGYGYSGGNGGTGYGYQSQQHYNYGAGQSNTTVINSQGKMAICQTINNVTTCF